MIVKTRLATEQDLNKILDIVNDAIANTTANYNYEPQTLEQQLLWFKDKKNKNFPVLVAVTNNVVVGFGTYGTFREKIGYQYTVEHSVYIDNNFIAKGIGSVILHELINLAKLQKLHVMIGCIDASNSDSIAFHTKFGFKIAGTLTEVAYKFDRWLNLVLMELKL